MGREESKTYLRHLAKRRQRGERYGTLQRENLWGDRSKRAHQIVDRKGRVLLFGLQKQDKRVLLGDFEKPGHGPSA